MNPLALKEKLRIKPKVEDIEKVAIVIKDNVQPIKKQKKVKKIKKVEFQEEGKSNETEREDTEVEVEDTEGEEEAELGEPFAKPVQEIVDETEIGFDREAYSKKLEENKKLKVTIKPLQKISEEKQFSEPLPAPLPAPLPVKKPKKVEGKKPLLIIEEDDEEGQQEPSKKKSEEERIEVTVPKKKERKTKKVEKGVAVLGPEIIARIGDTDLKRRLPKKLPSVIVKVSSYYMNNREIFVNFINSLFEPYRRELEENKDEISCDKIGRTSTNFSLLTHQKIVRDYMNLYTPYRGLLLYHGLGSGKTATSIAIAEGMKDSKRVIVMVPASLRANYIEELKKAGDLLYKRNQFWEWISVTEHPEALKTISGILNLPMEYIKRHRGAFFVNISKESNYDILSDADKKVLEEQLNEMIQQKYTFINYNGLRADRLIAMTSNFTKNIFDNAVVIIDEAHNLISRIVNKLKKETDISGEEKKKKKDKKEDEKAGAEENIFGEDIPISLSTKLYYMLLRAQNSRIVLLTGTPVINYPNEFAILFNILRGFIKTWRIPLIIKTKNKVDRETLHEMLLGEKTMDYLDYSPSSKILTITRNPFGFKNKIKLDTGYQGVSNNKKGEKGETTFETEFISDDEFERKIIGILRRNDIDIVSDGIQVINKKALPDDLNSFMARYINDSDKKIKNVDSLKRRILGLSSYFKSAQESLLPRFNKELGVDYHIVNVVMSDFQFKIYEGARIVERKLEKKKPKSVNNELFEEKASTYRIFSRLFCNYVIPDRPMPLDKKREKSLERLKDEMGIDIIYMKLKEQMKPGIDPILDQIVNAGEKRSWEIKIDNELRSYVKDVIIAQKKGKKASDVKLMNIIKDLQKVEEIIKHTKREKKNDEEEIENIGKRLEAFDLEQALLETGENPEENDAMTALLQQARKEETRQDLQDQHEGEIEGDEILEKIGGDSYKERLELAIRNIENHSNDFLTPEALQTYSPKFLHMLENIQDPEYIGLHLVYTQFRTAEGVGLFNLVLKKNGFARFSIKKNLAGIWEIDIPEIDEGKPTFALYTGTETSEEKEIIRHIYNGEWDDIPDSIASVLKSKFHNNNMGEVIKVLMITSSGSEGINLRNTRYVHIMEPYWHPVRLEQVIGRARRICSHKDLPEALQTVEVFVYIMVFSESQLKSDEAVELKRKDLSKAVPMIPQTSDQYLFEISEIKSNLTKQLTDAIKESAFDCYIYSNGKCVNFGEPSNDKFSYVPDFAEQQNDTTVQANKQAIEWVGKPIELNKVKYIYRRMSKKLLNIYNYDSYMAAIDNPEIAPVLVGTLEINSKGEQVFKELVV